jgi:glycosyltransferase involved in cell wall biosynthesis
LNKFHVITPAYNCSDGIEQTLISVMGQTNKDWSMTVIDDMSTDGTAGVVRAFARNNQAFHKISVITRTEKYGEVRNTLDVCSRLDPETIVIRLDAGDWLTDLGCFEILSRVYDQYDAAVVWTAHRWAWTNQNISGPIDPNISVYEQPWKSSHLKTFRVRDFMGLNPKNFLDDDGNHIMIACDQAVFLPMMERARKRGRPLVYIPMLMYHYSIDLQKPDLFTCDRSLMQKQSAEWIRERGYIDEDSV